MRDGTRRLALLGVALLPALLAADAPPGKKIIWYRMDYPPIYILSGPFQNKDLQAPVDGALKRALEAHGYTLSFGTANQERIRHDLQSGKPACSSALVRDPKLEETFEYSIAHSLALPSGVLIAKRDLERFQRFLDTQGQLDLDALLADSGFRLGLASSRVYGGVIDELLARHGKSAHIFWRSGLDISDGVLRMLLGGRIHYTLMYPWEAVYLARQMRRESEIAALPVKGMLPYVQVVAGCPKNAWGKAVIAIVNDAFRAVRNTPEFHAVKEFWLDENSRVLYRAYVKEFFEREAPAR
jgi:uncharacterized protein (TIGR02285 family)